MISKRASQLSYNVSPAEKIQAEKALICFKHTKRSLKQAIDYLNLMHVPFKENPSIPPEQIFKFRAVLRRFRDKAVENFNKFKIVAFECINAMQIFTSDTQIYKLIKTFINLVDEIESGVNKLVDEFNELKSKTFVENVIKYINTVQASADQLEEIINDRIISHIQENILASTWLDNVSKDLNKNIKKKDPLLVELYNKNQQKINQGK